MGEPPQPKRPRQAKGDGSRPRKRKDGRYVAYLTLEDGHRRYVYGRTSAECSAELRELRVKRATGQLAGNDRLTLEQFLNWWLDEQIQGSKKSKTYRIYEQICRTHLIPHLGKRRIGALTTQQVQAFLNERKASGNERSGKGLSSRSVSHIRAVLRNALNRAIRQGIVTRNVAELADPPRIPRHRVKPLTPDQALTLRDGLVGHRHEALYLVAMVLGLRVGEVLGLRWDDLSADYRQLTCARQLDRVDGKYVLVEHKRDTSTAYRALAVPSFVAAALHRHCARQTAEREMLGDAWEGESWNLVFPTEAGLPMNEARPSHEIHRILRQLELPDQRFHDLRHSAASLMLKTGATMKEVSEALGHSQISLTMNTYGHLYDEVKRENADRLDVLFNAKPLE